MLHNLQNHAFLFLQVIRAIIRNDSQSCHMLDSGLGWDWEFGGHPQFWSPPVSYHSYHSRSLPGVQTSFIDHCGLLCECTKSPCPQPISSRNLHHHLSSLIPHIASCLVLQTLCKRFVNPMFRGKAAPSQCFGKPGNDQLTIRSWYPKICFKNGEYPKWLDSNGENGTLNIGIWSKQCSESRTDSSETKASLETKRSSSETKGLLRKSKKILRKPRLLRNQNV